MPESVVPARSALRKVGIVIRMLEERTDRSSDVSLRPTAADALGGWPSTPRGVGPEVEAAIRATVLDYYEGWYDADPARMRARPASEPRQASPGMPTRPW